MLNLDTIPLDSVNKNMAPYLWTLKIAPVEIEYEINKEKIISSSIFKFSCIIKGKEIAFKFNTLPMKIREINSLKHQ